MISPDGQLISSKISRSSGFPGFDDAIIEILRDAVPYPNRPPRSARTTTTCDCTGSSRAISAAAPAWR